MKPNSIETRYNNEYQGEGLNLSPGSPLVTSGGKNPKNVNNTVSTLTLDS